MSGDNDMLSRAVEEDALGLLKDLSTKLEGEGGGDWLEALKRFLRKENPWAEAQKAVSGLLELITTVELPAIKTFRTKDYFKVDTAGEVAIGWIGDNFRRVFLDGDGKVETDVAQATLGVHKLLKSSVISPIIAELGGEEVAETSLAQMYEMMKAQGHGQQGILLINGFASIFLVRDAKGILWAVGCSWYSPCADWSVEAYPVTYPSRWHGGFQVVSR